MLENHSLVVVLLLATEAEFVTGFPRSWKIIENPGKINFPGKSWKSHGKLIKIHKSWKN